MRFIYICPFANFSRDFFMHFFYICPFTNFSRDFSMHFFYICPSGNFHRDFQAYFFSICPQNTKKRTRKRNVPTQKHSLFHYVFIFPVLSVSYSPCLSSFPLSSSFCPCLSTFFIFLLKCTVKTLFQILSVFQAFIKTFHQPYCNIFCSPEPFVKSVIALCAV